MAGTGAELKPFFFFFLPTPIKNKGFEGGKKAKTMIIWPRQCLSPAPLCELSAFPSEQRAKLQFGNYSFTFFPAERSSNMRSQIPHTEILGRPESGIDAFSGLWCFQDLGSSHWIFFPVMACTRKLFLWI